MSGIGELYDFEIDTLDVSHRLDGWQKRFVYLVDEELAKPFTWQYAHCADLMAVAVLACYDLDHPVLEMLQPQTDMISALRYLRDLGGFEGVLGEYFVEVPYSHAFNADIALYKNADGSVAGAIVCDGQLIGRSMDGSNHAIRLPLSKAYKVYRV